MFFEELLDSSFRENSFTYPQNASIVSCNKGDVCLYEFALRFPRSIDFHKEQKRTRSVYMENMGF